MYTCISARPTKVKGLERGWGLRLKTLKNTVTCSPETGSRLRPQGMTSIAWLPSPARSIQHNVILGLGFRVLSAWAMGLSMWCLCLCCPGLGHAPAPSCIPHLPSYTGAYSTLTDACLTSPPYLYHSKTELGSGNKMVSESGPSWMYPQLSAHRTGAGS